MNDEPIDRNPDMLGGTPVFTGTRVPVRILMEYLEAGDRLDDFLEDFPSVSRDQAVAVLERARQTSARVWLLTRQADRYSGLTQAVARSSAPRTSGYRGACQPVASGH
ncbi:MAG: DUF433 domain-containing protein [Rhodospirillaceae bacterium]|nr:DUF433 domain-containing protein [Rhodospirillaceae bacterium]